MAVKGECHRELGHLCIRLQRPKRRHRPIEHTNRVEHLWPDVVQYQYDVYGKTLSTTIPLGVTTLGKGLAAFNPFQYRLRRLGLG